MKKNSFRDLVATAMTMLKLSQYLGILEMVNPLLSITRSLEVKKYSRLLLTSLHALWEFGQHLTPKKKSLS